MQQPSYRSKQAPEAEQSVRRREGGINAELKTDQGLPITLPFFFLLPPSYSGQQSPF